jgi:hypothetical protein
MRNNALFAICPECSKPHLMAIDELGRPNAIGMPALVICTCGAITEWFVDDEEYLCSILQAKADEAKDQMEAKVNSKFHSS